MKYISLFAGIGGFDLALNRLGHTCVWANEWNKYAAEIYNKNFEEAQGWGNSGSWADSPNTDGESRAYWGSKPTHGVDTRDIRTVPTAQIYNSNFVNTETQDSNEELESNTSRSNGKRWGSHANGIDTRDIRAVPTSEIPDHDLLVGGFPCQAFSIAGKRRGFDDTRGTLFFEIARILKDKQPKLFILENVKGLLSHDGGNTFKTIISTLTELGYDLQWQVLNSKNFGVPQNRERVFIVGHLRGEPRPKVFPITGDSQQTATVAGYVSEEDWPRRHEQIRRVYKTDGAMPTIPTGTGGGVMTKIMTDTRIRRLTPTECERLQGFPDGWTEGISDTQRYKCLGNAVTVNVVEEIAKRL